jgi:pimeloyl-ACP methyl ester carboxylesterase
VGWKKTDVDHSTFYGLPSRKWSIPSRRAVVAGAAVMTLATRSTASVQGQTSLRMAQTPSLNLGYEETGPDTGYPVLLLHGWPYDPRSFDEVTGPLADAGYRVIILYSPCYGPTVHRSLEIFRTGQQAALGKDVIDLMDALYIPKATLAGFDWGNRAGCVVSALWPERVRAFVSSPGYVMLDIPTLAKQPGTASTIRQNWYRWFMNTPNGPAVVAAERDDLAGQCWEAWSPTRRFAEEFFSESAKSFQNPDWIETTIHCYRYWYGNARGDPALQQYEEQLETSVIGHPPSPDKFCEILLLTITNCASRCLTGISDESVEKCDGRVVGRVDAGPSREINDVGRSMMLCVRLKASRRGTWWNWLATRRRMAE